MSEAAQAGSPTGSLEVALAHAERLLDTDPALAAEQAGEILRAVGDHPAAWLLLANAHALRGGPREALEILAPLAVAQPRSARVQFAHGQALAALGRGTEAIVAIRRALALKPDLRGAWLALADQCMALDDTATAAAAYAGHVRHSTR